MKQKLVWLLTLVSLISCTTVRGNGAVFGGEGNVVYPLNSKDIELTSEQIFIRLNAISYETWIHVDCFFHLKNHGPDQEVQIGFPGNGLGYGDDIETLAVEDLSLRLKPKIVVKKSEYYRDVYTWTSAFRSRESKLLKVSYTFRMSSADGQPGEYFGYILETGALWRGPIQRSDIYIEFGRRTPLPAVSASPHNYLYTGNRLEWHFADLEPDFNVKIRLYDVSEEKLSPDMFYPFQADIGDDYLWDEEFYFAGGWVGIDEDKNNPEYVAVANRRIEELAEVRNSIFARHGFIFQSDKWRLHFSQKPWYRPDPGFSTQMLNSIEKRNIEYLLKIERQLQDTLK